MATLQEMASGVGPSGNYIGTPGDVWLGGSAPETYTDPTTGKLYNQDFYQHQYQQSLQEQATIDAKDAQDKKDYQDWQTATKLKQAVKDSQDQKTGQMLDSSLADNLSKAAADIIGYGDMKKGFETLALSKKYQDSADASQKEDVALAGSKMSLGNDILATVNDEASFQNAKVQMAGLGPTFAIPPQYTTYDDNAKNWVDNRRQFSARGIAAAKVQLATQTAALNAETQANRVLTEQAKTQQTERDEALARNPKQKILAPADQAEYQSQLSTFIPDTWGKVDTPNDKAAATQNWYDKTALYQSQGMPLDQAKIKAAGDVKSQFSSEGKFVPQAKGTTITNPTIGGNGVLQTTAPKTQADFNAIPSGALYINPSDGKTYKKK